MKYFWILFFIPSIAFAHPRFPNPKTPDEIGQNDRDLDDDLREKTIELSTDTSNFRLSDGTNNFAFSTLDYWKIKLNPSYYQVYVSALFSSGLSVTGHDLYISGFDFKIDTTGLIKGYSQGSIIITNGSDPRGYQGVSIVSSTTIKIARSNGSSWSPSADYLFNWTGLIPRTK